MHLILDMAQSKFEFRGIEIDKISQVITRAMGSECKACRTTFRITSQVSFFSELARTRNGNSMFLARNSRQHGRNQAEPWLSSHRNQSLHGQRRLSVLEYFFILGWQLAVFHDKA